MRIYSCILQVLGYCNITLCVTMSIYGRIFPEKIVGNMTLNSIVTGIVGLSYFLMFILFGGFYLLIGKSEFEKLIEFNVLGKFIFIISMINLIVCLFLKDSRLAGNNTFVAGDKLMAALAGGICLNIVVIVATMNFGKSR